MNFHLCEAMFFIASQRRNSSPVWEVKMKNFFECAPQKSKEKIIIIHIKFFLTKRSSTGRKSSTLKNTVRLHTHLLGKKKKKL
jgi:hypothetical protein